MRMRRCVAHMGGLFCVLCKMMGRVGSYVRGRGAHVWVALGLTLVCSWLRTVGRALSSLVVVHTPLAWLVRGGTAFEPQANP